MKINGLFSVKFQDGTKMTYNPPEGGRRYRSIDFSWEGGRIRYKGRPWELRGKIKRVTKCRNEWHLEIKGQLDTKGVEIPMEVIVNEESWCFDDPIIPQGRAVRYKHLGSKRKTIKIETLLSNFY